MGQLRNERPEPHYLIKDKVLFLGQRTVKPRYTGCQSFAVTFTTGWCFTELHTVAQEIVPDSSVPFFFYDVGCCLCITMGIIEGKICNVDHRLVAHIGSSRISARRAFSVCKNSVVLQASRQPLHLHIVQF